MIISRSIHVAANGIISQWFSYSDPITTLWTKGCDPQFILKWTEVQTSLITCPNLHRFCRCKARIQGEVWFTDKGRVKTIITYWPHVISLIIIKALEGKRLVKRAGSHVEKLEAGTWLEGKWNGAAAVENRVVGPQKLTQSYRTIRQFTPGSISKGTESNVLKRCLHINVHRSIIHNNQRWKQPKCPPTDQRINKMWSVYTVEYSSALGRPDLLTQARTWMKLENMLSDTRQSWRRPTPCDST